MFCVGPGSHGRVGSGGGEGARWLGIGGRPLFPKMKKMVVFLATAEAAVGPGALLAGVAGLEAIVAAVVILAGFQPLPRLHRSEFAALIQEMDGVAQGARKPAPPTFPLLVHLVHASLRSDHGPGFGLLLLYAFDAPKDALLLQLVKHPGLEVAYDRRRLPQSRHPSHVGAGVRVGEGAHTRRAGLRSWLRGGGQLPQVRSGSP